ncbi:MAG: peptide ABC transporter substrate-binding protein [Flavobacteriaceae bacterium]|nr:peptide ABC transporter substrate-binding protein [Flavobacteriaceae bacterium]
MKKITSIFFVAILYGCGSSVSPVDQGLIDQVMHIGNGSEPQGLDPHIVTGVPEHNLLITMCEGLTISNPEGGDNLPGMAESWEISEDGKTYIFNIRKDAKWSNGDDFVADDVVWSWMRILTPSLGSQYQDMLYYVIGAEDYYKTKSKKFQITKRIEEITAILEDSSSDLIDELKGELAGLEIELKEVDEYSFDNVGVKAIDQKTLEVKLNSPTTFFIGLLSHYSTWPVHKETVLKFGDIDDRRGEWTKEENFVCNGAMKLKSWETNKKIVVEKNPLYWDADQVRLNEMHFYPISDINTEERMFRDNKLHLTSTFPPNKCPMWEENNPHLKIDPYMGTYFYRINTKVEPLDDIKIRKALSLAIDRELLTEKVSKCGQAPAYSFTPPGSAGYFPDTEINYDPVLAKQLIAEAGFPNGENFPSLTILFNTSEGHQQIAVAIQQMWKRDLGIDVQLENTDWKVYLDREKVGNFQISRAGWIGDYKDPNTFLDTLRPERGNNKTGWANMEFDALIEKANNTNDKETRYSILMEAERILIDEMPIIPIYTYVSAYQLSPDVKGYYPNYLNHHHPKTLYLERD